ncbi:MAG: hypothetical protein HY677_05700 [Chloroflexi bacterium]|nr:hypothetical protein [Chloroflexota bacterium]
MRVTAKELYGVRRARIEAERRALLARLAEISVQEHTLELELKYGLLTGESALDLLTGQIGPARRGSSQQSPGDGKEGQP